MRKIYLCFAVAATFLALPACTTSGDAGIGSPIAVCERTTSDEKAVTGVNLAYKAFRKTVEVGVNVGFIKGELAGKVAAADRTAFATIVNVDTVYRTCSGDLNAAIGAANAAVNAALATIPVDDTPRREQ